MTSLGSTRTAPGAPDRAPVLEEFIAAAAAAVPGVVRVGSAPGIPLSTFLPGRTVDGVRCSSGRTVVHVHLDWDCDLPAIAENVRESVAPLTPGPVDIVVSDIADPASSPHPAVTGAAPRGRPRSKE